MLMPMANNGTPATSKASTVRPSRESGRVAAVNSQARSTSGASPMITKARPLSSRPMSLGAGPTGRVRR